MCQCPKCLRIRECTVVDKKTHHSLLFLHILSQRNETGTILHGKASPLKVCKRKKLGGSSSYLKMHEL